MSVAAQNQQIAANLRLASMAMHVSHGDSVAIATLQAQVLVLQGQVAAFGAIGQPIIFTTSGVLTAAQNGGFVNNFGASGAIVVSLPLWAQGLSYSFTVASAHALSVATQGLDIIGLMGGAFSSMSSSELYGFLNLNAANEAGLWLVRSMVGGWAAS